MRVIRMKIQEKFEIILKQFVGRVVFWNLRFTYPYVKVKKEKKEKRKNC